MKMFIRGFVFTILSINTALLVLPALHFGDQKVFFLVVLALALLNIFLKPLISLVSLPSSGPIFLFLSIVMNLILLNILTVIIPGFSIQTAHTHDLLIFGYMLPSKNLSGFLAGVACSVVIGLVYGFFNWLCVSNKKK